MVSRASLQVSFFIITLCWAMITAPYLTEYYFSHPRISESWGDAFEMLCVITFVTCSVPFAFWVLFQEILDK